MFCLWEKVLVIENWASIILKYKSLFFEFRTVFSLFFIQQLIGFFLQQIGLLIVGRPAGEGFLLHLSFLSDDGLPLAFVESVLGQRAIEDAGMHRGRLFLGGP